jgi:hypothetical protein
MTRPGAPSLLTPGLLIVAPESASVLYYKKGMFERGPRQQKEVPMTYTNADLKNKILEMYPEIGKHSVGVVMTFDGKKNAYLLTFTRGKDVLTTHLEKHDADECMNGIKCVYLGVQVAQFIKNFEERVVFGRQAA